MKAISVSNITQNDIEQMGRKRSFKRNSDNAGVTINAIKNKKTGVTVMVAGNANQIRNRFSSDNMVVESKIKAD